MAENTPNQSSSNQINTRIAEELQADLDELCTATGIKLPALIHALLVAANQEFKRSKQLAFPMAVLPKKEAEEALALVAHYNS